MFLRCLQQTLIITGMSAPSREHPPHCPALSPTTEVHGKGLRVSGHCSLSGLPDILTVSQLTRGIPDCVRMFAALFLSTFKMAASSSSALLKVEHFTRAFSPPEASRPSQFRSVYCSSSGWTKTSRTKKSDGFSSGLGKPGTIRERLVSTLSKK